MKTLITTLLLFFLGYTLFGQEKHTEDSSKISRILLNEVVVSASKFEENKQDVPQRVEVINKKEIENSNTQNPGDLLMQSGNVLVQKSQMGGGSPIIRGFEANKVLLVVDGVRMNNAIYRGGHLQNILTLDNSMLEKVEVVFGPGSVVYGSDALGGVMHFYTRKPKLSTGNKMNFSANAFTRYSSANNERSGHLDFNAGFKRWAFLTSISYSDFSDLRQGNVRNTENGNWGKRMWYAKRINGKDSMMANPDPNKQVQSAYTQYDIMQKILFKQNDHTEHLLNIQYSTSSDIPRYDRLTQMSGSLPKYAQWYYGPQKRLMTSYHLNLDNGNRLYDKARLVTAYQNIEESRHDRRFGRNALNNRIEQLDIVSLNIDFMKQVRKNEIRYGAEGFYNLVNSTANEYNIATGEKSALDTRYPDGGSTMQSYAAYVTHSWEISPKFILCDGLRYSNINMNSRFVDKTFFPFPFDQVTQKSNAVNGNLGMVYMPGQGWRFALTGSSGFRAPNVDDLSKVFESVPGSVVVPNPNLKPEYTYNIDLSVSKTIANKARIGVNGFYTWYRDAITTRPGQFNGMDSIDYNGEMSRVTMTMNTQNAYLYGINGDIQADLTSFLAVNTSLTYTYARIKTDTTDYPLDHIPPMFGKTSVIVKANKFRGEFYALYNGWKKLKDYNEFGEDNLSYATPKGMPSWYTLNLRASYQVSNNIQIQAGIENILDQNYRVFASNISAPGRNFIVTLRGRF